MSRTSYLLSTTALAGAACLALASIADAAEVKPIGALDVNIGGFVRTYALIGNLKDKTGDQNGSYDFRTDNEVYIYARGTDEATGLQYGANVELEADTSSTGNADEAFVFISGTFGDIRFGDDDGAIENSIVGAATVAAFTGGLDGAGPFDYGALVYGITSDDSTKIIYYSPSLGGVQVGASYTPHVNSSGQDIGVTNDAGLDDFVEGALTYTGSFGDFGILAAVTGGLGSFNTNFDQSEDVWHYYGGLSLTAFGFKVAGGYGQTKGTRPVYSNDQDDAYIGNFILEPGAKNQFYNVGVGGTFGPANVSLNWGQTLSSETGGDELVTGGSGGGPGRSDPEPYAAVLSVDFGLAPGLVVGGEVAYFENGDNQSNNDGILGITGIRLAF